MQLTKQFRNIEWVVNFNDLLDEEPEEQLKVYSTTGRDNKGCYYEGEAFFLKNIFSEVKSINRVLDTLDFYDEEDYDNCPIPFYEEYPIF